MMDSWLAFSRTGNPNPRPAAGVPTWRTYNLKNRYTMLWDDKPTLVRSPDEARRQAWEPYPFTNFNYELPIG